jgi:hypothetical protein
VLFGEQFKEDLAQEGKKLSSLKRSMMPANSAKTLQQLAEMVPNTISSKERYQLLSSDHTELKTTLTAQRSNILKSRCK